MTNVTKSANVPAVAASIDEETLTLTLEFSNGQKLVVEADSLSADITRMATLHGLKQKLVDAAAIGRDPITGRSATIGDKFEAVNEVYRRITSLEGTWNKIREGEGAAPSGGLLVRALMQLGGKSKEAITEQLATLNKEQLSALRANKRVAETIASLRQAPASSDELLAGIIG